MIHTLNIIEQTETQPPITPPLPEMHNRLADVVGVRPLLQAPQVLLRSGVGISLAQGAGRNTVAR